MISGCGNCLEQAKSRPSRLEWDPTLARSARLRAARTGRVSNEVGAVSAFDQALVVETKDFVDEAACMISVVDHNGIKSGIYVDYLEPQVRDTSESNGPICPDLSFTAKNTVRLREKLSCNWRPELRIIRKMRKHGIKIVGVPGVNPLLSEVLSFRNIHEPTLAATSAEQIGDYSTICRGSNVVISTRSNRAETTLGS